MFDRYGLVVVDECHHLPAVSFAPACSRPARRRWLGLTATPYRRDKLEALIGFHCGPTRHEIKPAAVDGAELRPPRAVVHHTATEVDDDEAAHIQEVFAALVDDDRRTAQICADVHTAVAAGRTCLVLTQRTDHIDAIVAGLAALGDARARAPRRARQARPAPRSPTPSPHATPTPGSCSSPPAPTSAKGFDWPELDTLFLAFPLAFKGRVVQYVGRLLRTHAGKHHVELHDYVDSRIPVLDRMHAKRHPRLHHPRLRHPQTPATAAPSATTST